MSFNKIATFMICVLFILPTGRSHSFSQAASEGAVIQVNTTADEIKNNGKCSLREAIQAANTDTAVDGCPAGNGANLPAGDGALFLWGAKDALPVGSDVQRHALADNPGDRQTADRPTRSAPVEERIDVSNSYGKNRSSAPYHT